jgi:hypothetical protein
MPAFPAVLAGCVIDKEKRAVKTANNTTFIICIFVNVYATYPRFVSKFLDFLEKMA